MAILEELRVKQINIVLNDSFKNCPPIARFFYLKMEGVYSYMYEEKIIKFKKAFSSDLDCIKFFYDLVYKLNLYNEEAKSFFEMFMQKTYSQEYKSGIAQKINNIFALHSIVGLYYCYFVHFLYKTE